MRTAGCIGDRRTQRFPGPRRDRAGAGQADRCLEVAHRGRGLGSEVPRSRLHVEGPLHDSNCLTGVTLFQDRRFGRAGGSRAAGGIAIGLRGDLLGFGDDIATEGSPCPRGDRAGLGQPHSRLELLDGLASLRSEVARHRVDAEGLLGHLHHATTVAFGHRG